MPLGLFHGPPVALTLLLCALVAFPADAQRPNRNHWPTEAAIGRDEGPVGDQALRDAPSRAQSEGMKVSMYKPDD